MENGEKFLVAHTNNKGIYKDHYYFIRSPGIKHDVPNVFRLIAVPQYNELIPLSVLKPAFVEKVRASEVGASEVGANEVGASEVGTNVVSIESYFEKIGQLAATMRLKEKKVKLVVSDVPVAVPVADVPFAPAVGVKKTKKKLKLTD
jgi:hypothetical protein